MSRGWFVVAMVVFLAACGKEKTETTESAKAVEPALEVKTPESSQVATLLHDYQLQLSQLDARVTAWQAALQRLSIKALAQPLSWQASESLLRGFVQELSAWSDATIDSAKLAKMKGDVVALSAQYQKATAKALAAAEAQTKARQLAQEWDKLATQKLGLAASFQQSTTALQDRATALVQQGQFDEAAKIWLDEATRYQQVIDQGKAVIQSRADADTAQQTWKGMADRFGKVAAADAALQQWQGAAVLALQGDLKAAADRFQQSQKGWEKARYDGLLKLAVPATVRIAGGTFLMGDRSGKGQRDEQPVHEVTLSAFAMAATETTVAQYDAYAELAGLSPVAANNGGDQDRLPVVNVTHDQAMAYAKWLSKQTGEAWSLPTEEQWEYAARAGGAKEYGQSDSVAGKANCEGCVRWNNKGAQPVAQLPANTYGLYDMQGNVWEWTLGCYTASYAEPKTEADCARYTVRGGSWADLPPELRVSNRSAVPVGERSNRIGFRLVKTQP